MAYIYDKDGNIIDVGGGGTASAIDYDKCVKGIAHRGYSTVAPENTLPAYKLAKQMGFNYVEADIVYTSDNVPVLSHDTTIDRCSDGSGTISNMTFEQLQQYDFGSWKSSAYAGTKIPSASQFLYLCKALGLHPYFDLRNATQAQYQILVDAVEANGMTGKVTYVSGSSNLAIIKTLSPSARLGIIHNSAVTSSLITTAQGLQTESNEVFIDCDSYYANAEACTLCQGGDIPLEIWTINNTSTILNMNPYITGVTSDGIIAGKVLYEANIN